MENNPEESSIERLKRNLYSRNEALIPKEKRTPVPSHENNVPMDWGTKTSFDLKPEDMVRRNNSFFNKFLMWSLVFFAISLGVALFIFFGGLNMISSNNLDINVVSPSSVSSGEQLAIALSVVNGNRTDLEDATLFVDYPDGAESISEDGKVLVHDKIDLGTIESGKSLDHTLQAVLFGEKEAIKTFILRLEYKVKGSNAVFSKEKTFDISIGSSPLIMDIDYPKEVNSGQLVSITLNFTSNASVPVKNTLVKIEYPYGFTYKESSIKPFRDNTVWKLGDLKNGDKKTLVIKGILVGQNLEDRSFRISAGSQSSDTSKDFDTPLATGIFTMGIRKSFFGLSVGSEQGPVSNPGQFIPMSIRWQNTVPDRIVNARIEAKLSGNAFDRNKVSVAAGGFYRSVDNTITWDKNGNPNLETLLPGDENLVSFTMASLADLTTGTLVKNPHIDIHVVMIGDRSGTDTIEVSSEENVTIKIASVLGIKAKSLRDTGPFSNSGPIPPKADNETTYTITWTLSNSTNDLKGTFVSTTLPVGVEWKNQTSPSGEKIEYNPSTRQVTWTPGNVSSGVGYGFAPREVSFKIGITPSINQIGSSPVLIGETAASGTDTYAEKTIGSIAQPVTTRYSDATYVSGREIVVK